MQHFKDLRDLLDILSLLYLLFLQFDPNKDGTVIIMLSISHFLIHTLDPGNPGKPESPCAPLPPCGVEQTVTLSPTLHFWLHTASSLPKCSPKPTYLISRDSS